VALVSQGHRITQRQKALTAARKSQKKQSLVSETQAVQRAGEYSQALRSLQTISLHAGGHQAPVFLLGIWKHGDLIAPILCHKEMLLLARPGLQGSAGFSLPEVLPPEAGVSPWPHPTPAPRCWGKSRALSCFSLPESFPLFSHSRAHSAVISFSEFYETQEGLLTSNSFSFLSCENH
jgi:hypothetical protein